jgi:nicotinamide-nucleotide amidase
MTTPTDLVADVVAGLKAASLTIGTAESLTGGLVCATLTQVPGASAVVRGGVVAYATDLKAGVLGVDRDLLARGGAVQPEVAAQMAQGVCRLLGCDVGVATTGVAGPDPQDGQPVGTAFVAVAVAGSGSPPVQVRALALHGSRDSIRHEVVQAALSLVAEVTGVAEVTEVTGVAEVTEVPEDSGRGRR